MATSSEVEVGMTKITNTITVARDRLKSAKEQVSIQEANLNALVANNQDVLDTINAYMPTGAFEEYYKADLAKKTAEYLALVAEVTAAKNDLVGYTEF